MGTHAGTKGKSPQIRPCCTIRWNPGDRLAMQVECRRSAGKPPLPLPAGEGRGEGVAPTAIPAPSRARPAPSPNPLPEGEGFFASPSSRACSRHAASMALRLPSSTRVTCTASSGVISPPIIASTVASYAATRSPARVPSGRSMVIARLRGRGSSRSRQNRAVTTSPATALSMMTRAIAGPSSESSAARSSVARLRVPGTLPAGLPDCPGTNRPRSSRAEACSNPCVMTVSIIRMFMICSF